MRPYRIGTSSGIRLSACRWRSVIGSGRSDSAVQVPWLDLGAAARAAFPLATRSSGIIPARFHAGDGSASDLTVVPRPAGLPVRDGAPLLAIAPACQCRERRLNSSSDHVLPEPLGLPGEVRYGSMAVPGGSGTFLRMASEPPLVVERRKELTYLLCQAAELEHALMCEYLYAAFSLRSRPGPGLRSDQMDDVERWRQVILSISAEEMLHWAIVQNLLTAVGSAPYVSRPHMPHQARGYPRGVQFRLLPFGEAALQHFVYLERPQGVVGQDAEGFEAGDAPLPPMAPEEVVPRGQQFATQGRLYRSIDAGLARLAGRMGEDRLFIGPAFHQADETAFRWPDLAPITDLQSASQALDRIVSQGEGATGDWTSAHYGRFLQVLDEYLTARKQDPEFDPVHPVVAAGMRPVEGVEPDVYISDRDTGGCSDLFNAVYELILQMIARYFAFGHETAEQRQVLAHAAVALMFGAIKPLGELLAQLPVGPSYQGATAGANFQLPYRASFLLPHRRSAWLRFAERLEELGDFAAGLHPAQGREVVVAVSEATGRLASAAERPCRGRTRCPQS